MTDFNEIRDKAAQMITELRRYPRIVVDGPEIADFIEKLLKSAEIYAEDSYDEGYKEAYETWRS